MMRLDRFLASQGMGTRSQVKAAVRSGLVKINGEICRRPEARVDETADQVSWEDRTVSYKKYRYYMLYKPAGTVSAVRDKTDPTVMELLADAAGGGLAPVGRLDKDTEGLLLITDDGETAHYLLSPRRHVDKTYLVRTRQPLDPEAVRRLEAGVDIGDERPTLPAKARLLGERELLLTIREGRFHQVKRMLEAVGNRVLSLKRTAFGPLKLDETLSPGQFRELTEGERQALLALCPGGGEKGDAEHPKTQAVIFDLDGSLVDSMWMWRQIDIDYLGQRGIPLPSTLQTDIEGMSMIQTARYFQERFQIEDPLEQIMAEWNRMAWDKYEHEVVLKPGAREFLERCRRAGIRLGIATSNSTELAETVLNSLGIRSYFHSVKTGSQVERGKPAPDIYLAAAEELGVSPAGCLVFEDIVPGIRAGAAAGMRVCAVEDDYSRDQDREKRELADYYITDYGEVDFL